MTRFVPTAITIPAIETELDRSYVQQFRNGDGQLIAISFAHDEFHSNLSGPVLHFQLPDGQVVLACPDTDGMQLIWQDSRERAEVEDGAVDVLNLMWGQLNESFHMVLLKSFGESTVKALAASLSAT